VTTRKSLTYVASSVENEMDPMFVFDDNNNDVVFVPLCYI